MKKTLTIFHTNEVHSAFINIGPSSDCTPFTLNDDTTRGGYARLAAMMATRKQARWDQGPVLVLDACDYSMGTAFGAASRETGGELRIMSLMGYDATSFGNHDFDLEPEGLAESISVAAKAGRIPGVLASNSNLAGSDPTLTELQRLAQDNPPPPRDRRYDGRQRAGDRLLHRRDQGIAGDHGSLAQSAGEDPGRTSHDSAR
jgi:5'-nucleotidase / UDP-sugar diphosphatase